MDIKRDLFIFSLCIPIILINSSANGLRCYGSIVSTGDTKQEVINKCGEPDHIEHWEEERIKGVYHYRDDSYNPFIEEEYVKVEEWTYNFGPTTFIRYLLFENGKLKEIRVGDKGYYR